MRRSKREAQRQRVLVTGALLLATFIVACVVIYVVIDRASSIKPRVNPNTSEGRAGKLIVPQRVVEFAAKFPGFNTGLAELARSRADENEAAARAVGSSADTKYEHVLDGMQADLISGGTIDLATAYAGHVLLIVNVASHCGFTAENYDRLEKLYRRHKPRKFTVLAFPCNQFGAQEADAPSEIMRFCRREKRATFPLFAKTDVNGQRAHPLFRRLKHALNVTAIEWNFGKFLVSRQGTPVRYFDHRDAFARVEQYVDAELAKPDDAE